VCTNGTNVGCTECTEGFFLQDGADICLNGCSNGFTSNTVTHECDADPAPTETACYTFDANIDNWTSETNNVSLNSFDITPVYERGLYFDGTDYMRFSSVMLHHTFSIEMWIRPDAPGVLFSSN
jgi:hypothetical protein